MRMFRIVLLCYLIALFSCNCVFAESDANIKFGKDQSVFVSGKLDNEYADQIITFIVTKKSVDLSELKKEDIYYVDELTTDENGYYELFFHIPQVVGANFDVWINECGELAEKCTVSDYTERIFIDADVDYVKKGDVYELKASLRNIFGYDEAVYNLFTAY